jgi:dTDP-4-amino-4,6-dideoxygalactose transaminase
MNPPPIRSHPHLSLRLLTHAPSFAMACALQLAPRLFHFSRDAIHALFGAFGYPNGTPVWMPSFHCGMEVRAAADAGFTPRFYRVKEDLTADEEDLAAGLECAPGPVLLIHYFGFPQPGIARMAALCSKLQVPLVEDCSHAFLSRFERRELGTFGHAATFSLYKTLGTVDGGALRADETELSHLTGRTVTLPAVPPPSTIAWGAHWNSLQRLYRDAPVRGRNERINETLRDRFASRVVTARRRIFEGKWLYGRGISRLSLALIWRLDPEIVRERRRRNYLHLDALLRETAGYRPVQAELPSETCPLYLPICVSNRTKVLLSLQAARIETFIFGMFNHPAMDDERFPESRRFRETILCLPVHQNLDEQDMERMALLLRPLLAAEQEA